MLSRPTRFRLKFAQLLEPSLATSKAHLGLAPVAHLPSGLRAPRRPEFPWRQPAGEEAASLPSKLPSSQAPKLPGFVRSSGRRLWVQGQLHGRGRGGRGRGLSVRDVPTVSSRYLIRPVNQVEIIATSAGSIQMLTTYGTKYSMSQPAK
jgi:hypothetical protein